MIKINDFAVQEQRNSRSLHRLLFLAAFMVAIYAPVALAATAVDLDMTWAVRAGGAGNDEASDVAILPDGGMIVTGYFSSTAYFASRPVTSAGNKDIFLVRYDADGDVLWVKRAGGSGEDWGRAVALASDGSIWVAGYFSGTAHFAPGEVEETTRQSRGGFDVFVAHFSLDGELLTVRQSGSSADDWPNDVSVASDNGVVVTGAYGKPMTVNSDGADAVVIPNAGPNDVFITRLAPDGILQWVRHEGGTGNDVTNMSAVGPEDQVAISGTYSAQVLFGAGTANASQLSSAGNTDGFVATYSSTGEFAWVRAWGGASDVDEARTVGFAQDGSLRFGINPRAGTIIDGRQIGDAFGDAVFMRLSADGETEWLVQGTGANSQDSRGLCVLPSGQAMFVGTMQAPTTIGDFTLNYTGGIDAFIGACGADGLVPFAYQVIRGPGSERLMRVDADARSVGAVGYFDASCTVGLGRPPESSLTSAGGHDIVAARFLPAYCNFAGGLVAHIEPAAPSLDDDLTCVASLTDASGEPDLAWTYSWFKDEQAISTPLEIDGQLLSISGPALSHYYLSLGHRYRCRVSVTDGIDTLRAWTQTVEFPIPTPPPGDVYSQGDLEWEPIMDANQSWEYGAVGWPCVLYDSEASLFKMWYASGNSLASTNGVWGGIAYAESLDGRTWTNKQLLLRATDDGGTSVGLGYPVVVKRDGTYYLYSLTYYQLYQGAYWNYITVRTGTDGIHWNPPTLITTPSDHEPWEDMYYKVKSVFPDSIVGGYRLFYSVQYARIPQSPRRWFASMTSADGLSWGGRIQARGETGEFIHCDYQPPMYQDGDLFRVLYVGIDRRLHRANSYDGIHWTGIIDGWSDEIGLREALLDPPTAVGEAQFVRMPNGSEYLYFHLTQAEGDKDVYQLARAMLRPPLNAQATARIEPSEPKTLDDLVCVVDIQAPTDAPPLSTSYRWFRNDVELAAPLLVEGIAYDVTGSVLPNEITTRGESYFCIARISDGTSFVTARTDAVVVRNTPPTAPVVKIVPDNPQPWDGLGAEFVQYSIDPDGDPISYEIRWYRSTDGGNTFVYRIEVSGVVPQGAWVPPAFLHDGDIWRVEAIPFEVATSKASVGADAAETRVDGQVGWDQAYVGENYRPVVVIEDPGASGSWANPSVRLSWRSSDADGDALRVDLYYDPDDYPGGEILIQAGLAGTGSLDWTPPRSFVPIAPADLNGDGILGTADVFQLALHWGVPLRGGMSYHIFARVWDSKNAVSTDTSRGSVLVAPSIPGDVNGLLDMLDRWDGRSH